MEKEMIEKIWKSLRKYPNVVGFEPDLRPKVKGGVAYPEILAIRIYVSKKIPMKEVKFHVTFLDKLKRRFKRSSEFLASDLIPILIEETPTDIIETGKFKALPYKARKNADDPKGKFRPIIAGVSACHKDCTACTVTGFFTHEGKVLLALNNHCGALENKASIGDAWIQPSPSDDGIYPLDKIATLHHFVEIKFNDFTCPYRNFLHKIWRTISRQTPLNRVDISFGEILEPFTVAAFQITDAFKGWRDPDIGEDVQKTGRTTGHTVAKVTSLNWVGQVGYGRGTASFYDCILIEGIGFSAGGDSGSPIFDLEGNLLGVLFAGSDQGFTIACKVGNIEVEGNVKLLLRES